MVIWGCKVKQITFLYRETGNLAYDPSGAPIKCKGSISSILDNVEGIGKERKKLLIKKYGSITKLKQAPLEEVQHSHHL